MRVRILLFIGVSIACSSTAHAGGIWFVGPDEFDDVGLVRNAQSQEEVLVFAKELQVFEKKLTEQNLAAIEQLFGKPIKWPEKFYTMPIARSRVAFVSGFRAFGKDDKNHVETYQAGNVAVVKVWYGKNGVSPYEVAVFLKVDKDFPKLTEKNLKERLAWEQERFRKLVKFVEEQEKKK